MLRNASRGLLVGALFATVMLAAIHANVAANEPPAEGGVLPEFELPVPQDSEARSYLGLTGGDTFTIPQIKAQMVIIEVYSMYCPFCQAEAPRVNELYRTIEKNDKFRGQIKVIGIAAGNTPFEVDFFRQKYDVPFPLFPDEDLSIHKVFGEVRTPYFIGVRISEDGSHRVFYSKLGGFKNSSAFLDEMLKLSGLS